MVQQGSANSGHGASVWETFCWGEAGNVPSEYFDSKVESESLQVLDNAATLV